MKPVKVDVLVPRYGGFGGTEHVINLVASHFNQNASSEVEFRIVLPKGTENNQWLGNNPVFRNKITGPTSLVRNLTGSGWVLGYLLKTDADIVIGISTRMIAFANRARKFFHKKYKIVSWLHFSLMHAKRLKLDDLRLADYHLAISSGIKSQMIDAGIDSERVFTIFNPAERVTQIVQPSSVPTFIFMGRQQFTTQKNLKELLDGLKIYQTTFGKNWQIRIFGTGPDENEIKEYTLKLGLSDKVIFEGYSTDAWAKITNATALILTSKFEGLPMVAIESVSRGLPVVSANFDTGADDIVKPQTGLIYELGNPVDLAEKLAKIFEIRSKYNLQDMTGTLRDMYADNYYAYLEKILKEIANEAD